MKKSIKAVIISTILAASFSASALTIKIPDSKINSIVKVSLLSGKLGACEALATKAGDYESAVIYGEAGSKLYPVNTRVQSAGNVEAWNNYSLDDCAKLIANL